MVAQTQFDPQNPDALFSPDQWLNQFSNFNNAALPWPSSYAGTPTNAMGQPIQSAVDANSAAQAQYQQQLAAYNQQKAGTTLNSTPSQGFQQGVPNTLNPSGNAMLGQLEWGGLPGTTNHQTAGAYLQGLQANPFSGAQQPQQQAAPSAPTPPNNWQSTIAALANPGKVTTPGATVPATASAQPGPANLQSFLANWKPAQSGPGSGFQQNFATALKGMGY